MGSVIRITPEMLGPDAVKRLARARAQTEQAIRLSMNRGRALVVSQTPVDLGQMKNSWRINNLTLENTAPHAGIIENGARPHPVNREGMQALEEWAMRQLGLDAREAKNAAFAIAQKIRKHGQKGHFIVKKSLKKLRQFAAHEIERMLSRIA